MDVVKWNSDNFIRALLASRYLHNDHECIYQKSRGQEIRKICVPKMLSVVDDVQELTFVNRFKEM